MAGRNLNSLRIGVGLLAGVLVWTACQLSQLNSPEGESLKFRIWLAENIFTPWFGLPAVNKPVVMDYAWGWWAYLLGAAALGSAFAILRPLPRFLLWYGTNTIVSVFAIYCFQVLQLVVPFGAPLLVLNCAYVCGTLIYLETEKISRNRQAAFELQLEAENERKRIAKELHDETLSSLSKVMRLADKLKDDDDQQSVSAEIRSRLESTVSEMRRIIDDLHPAMLQNLGLVPALEQLANRFSKDSGIAATFEAKAAEVKLEPFQSLCIFRIVQEALNNVEKHSGATKARVMVQQTDNSLRIEVSDNGTANGAVKSRVDSHGVQNIVHRASLIGGKVQWKKCEDFDSGTALLLTMPVSERQLEKLSDGECENVRTISEV